MKKTSVRTLWNMTTHWQISTFVWGDLVHRDAAAIWKREHDFRNTVITETPSRITIPFKLRLGDHRPHSAQD